MVYRSIEPLEMWISGTAAWWTRGSCGTKAFLTYVYVRFFRVRPEKLSFLFLDDIILLQLIAQRLIHRPRFTRPVPPRSLPCATSGARKTVLASGDPHLSSESGPYDGLLVNHHPPP